ncbi:isochorismatase family protein [Motilimonas sp. 1_MG-2023]|uniref:Isochorismatase family protein n=1 Tax=Motilimonas cestriensis TaxID=2742685 RepID=A0ABS8W8I1_9GAMM|nr:MULTISPECIES: isochorismatase family protein [Motilimonas]MCE2593690.1 isochorismatase family protein [Motilimonas cestriensis]MDO6528163.1 isochorismatase family protein [Motilimonas sp. 1_MG-2023]
MLDKNKTGLIVIDVQGKLADIVTDSEALLKQIHIMISGAKALNLPIIYLEQNPAKLGSTSPLLQSALDPVEAIAKYTFDACAEPEFVAAIKASTVTTWIICGIEAHICVYQTTSSLLQLGYQIELLEDGVASRSSPNKSLAIKKLMAQGASISCVEMCLYELVADCRAPEFKAILQLIK